MDEFSTELQVEILRPIHIRLEAAGYIAPLCVPLNNEMDGAILVRRMYNGFNKAIASIHVMGAEIFVVGFLNVTDPEGDDILIPLHDPHYDLTVVMTIDILWGQALIHWDQALHMPNVELEWGNGYTTREA